MSVIQKLLNAAGYEYKSAGDNNSVGGFSFEKFSLVRKGKLNFSETNLLDAYKTHELVFSCINKIADVMNDAEIIVEENKSGEWKRVEGHLLTALFKRPNRYETGRDFRRLMVQAEQTTGIFYAEMVRSGASLVVELNFLNPLRVVPKLNETKDGIGYYEYTRSDGKKVNIKTEDMLIRRRVDLTNRFFGLSPLSVALKSINSDLGLTDYVDAFFESDGTPSGILKVLNRSLTQTEAEALQAQWRAKFGRNGGNQKGTAVLDQNAEYQRIGANLNELDSQTISDRFESRICAAFGVPPNLVGALVGLNHATNNATAKAALRDFWDNKISPELAVFREWLTWFVLPEFDGIEAIQAGKIRVGFDISQAAFLQEDVDKIHARATASFNRGAITLNEYRQMIGVAPDPNGDYYMRISSYTPILPEQAAEQAKLGLTSKLFTTPEVVEGGGNITEGGDKPTTEDEKTGAKVSLNSGKDTLQLESNLNSQKKTKKSVEYDGMILGREPRGVELVINLKNLQSDFETEKEKATKILTTFRNELITQAVSEIEKLNEAEIYTLTLSPNPKTRKQVEKVLRAAYERGRAQVVDELNAQKSAKNIEKFIEKKDLDDDFDDITRFSDSVIAKIINEIQNRAVNLAVEATLLSISAELFLDWIKKRLSEESINFIIQTASKSVNKVVNLGRDSAFVENADSITYFTFSSIFDKNLCEKCEAVDGLESTNRADIPNAPYENCLGQSLCRCFVIAVAV